MIRAPSYGATFVPVKAYTERFIAPTGPNLEGAIGRALQALGNDTAGRARAIQDRAALAQLVADHAGLQGGAAVAAQSGALDAAQRIAAEGQATLGSPDMVAAYDQRMAPALDDATARITDHALRQAAVERQAVAAQELQAAQHSAAGDWNDPARLTQGLDTIRAMAAGRADPDAGDTDQAVRMAIGGGVAGAVGQALSAGEPEFATHILGTWGHSLTPAAYQAAIAQLGDAAQNQRMAGVFAQAAGGDAAPADGAVTIAAPAGAAVHPIAGGLVSAVDDHSVSVSHPDGSSTTLSGLGMPSVAPGDLVVPAHVIGSAGPQIGFAAHDPAGEPTDAATLLQSAGGPEVLIGATATPRTWNVPALLDRIAGRDDLTEADRAMAGNLALQRMVADHAQLAANDTAAGRAVVTLAAPGTISSAAGLPTDLTAQMTPASLRQVDQALRTAAQAPALPAPDNAAALRLQLTQRQSPGDFAQVNLAPLIGTVHPATLTTLAAAQAGQAASDDPRSTILDALARHEITSGSPLPDEALPPILGRATTLLRLSADPAALDSAVQDAIQSATAPT